jgi:hypothetical protein
MSARRRHRHVTAVGADAFQGEPPTFGGGGASWRLRCPPGGPGLPPPLTPRSCLRSARGEAGRLAKRWHTLGLSARFRLLLNRCYMHRL